MEVFKPVIDYEGLYEVSNYGRIRSVARTVEGKSRWGGIKKRTFQSVVLKQHFHYYWIVKLSKDGRRVPKLVHRLEYEAFYGKIPEGFQINHLDEDPKNNMLENLSLVTPSENINWGTRNERAGKLLKGRKGMINRKDLSKPIIQYDLEGNFVAEYPSISEAIRQTGFKHLYSFKKSPLHKSYGYIWEIKISRP